MIRTYLPFEIGDALSVRSLYTFSRRRFPAGYMFEGEAHDFTEVVCVTDGRAGITAGREVLVLGKGGLIVHPPREFHKIWSDGEEAETVIFSFRAETFPRLRGRAFVLSDSRLEELLRLCGEAEEVFTFSRESVTGVRGGGMWAASAFVKRLELFLLSVLSEGKASETSLPSRSAELYARIAAAIEDNLTKNLRAGELASVCGCSISALDKCVRRYVGRSAVTHYNDLRMRRAGELLLEGKSVKEVAAELEFSNQNYFSLAFKKWSGFCPTEYRG